MAPPFKMETSQKIMDDINANSDYDISWYCMEGNHHKCQSICSCKCHKDGITSVRLSHPSRY